MYLCYCAVKERERVVREATSGILLHRIPTIHSLRLRHQWPPPHRNHDRQGNRKRHPPSPARATFAPLILYRYCTRPPSPTPSRGCTLHTTRAKSVPTRPGTPIRSYDTVDKPSAPIQTQRTFATIHNLQSAIRNPQSSPSQLCYLYGGHAPPFYGGFVW